MRSSLCVRLLAGCIYSAHAIASNICSEDTACLGPKDCLYPYPGSCAQFIHCEVNSDNKTGTPILRDCPDGLEWNNDEKICDLPNESTCQKPLQNIIATFDEALPPPRGTLDSSFSCTTARSSQGCLGQIGGGLECIYANPQASSSYIQCTDGLAYVVPCKAGQTYRDALKACE